MPKALIPALLLTLFLFNTSYSQDLIYEAQTIKIPGQEVTESNVTVSINTKKKLIVIGDDLLVIEYSKIGEVEENSGFSKMFLSKDLMIASVIIGIGEAGHEDFRILIKYRDSNDELILGDVAQISD